MSIVRLTASCILSITYAMDSRHPFDVVILRFTVENGTTLLECAILLKVFLDGSVWIHG